MIEHRNQPRKDKLSPFKWGCSLLAGSVLGILVSTGSESTPLHPIMSTATPDIRSNIFTQVSVDLRLTATTVFENHTDTSFVETHEFSHEFFNTVRNTAFLLLLTDETSDNRQNSAGGTAWLAYQENDIYYFVTNRHVWDVHPKRISRSISLWRPGVDSEIFNPVVTDVLISPTSDVAIIQCKGQYPKTDTSPIQALHFLDDSLKINQSVLIVGYPGDFWLPDNKAIVYGNVLKIDEVVDGKQPSTSRTLSASGIDGPGGSGSPVVINMGGIPTVVGMASAISKTQQLVIDIVPLHIGELLASSIKK